MKNLVLVTATSLLLATSASAGGVTFSLPNLWFPQTEEATVTKNAPTTDVVTIQTPDQE